jgi:hypothetical protein
MNILVIALSTLLEGIIASYTMYLRSSITRKQLQQWAMFSACQSTV